LRAQVQREDQRPPPNISQKASVSAARSLHGIPPYQCTVAVVTAISGRGSQYGRDGEPVFTDGPYLESKEHIAGFWIIDAPHLDVALRLAALGSKNCNRRVELRPFLGE
jgi:hypothetical protein